MRQENLTTVKGGLNRLRTKGAALKDSLYELLNGYVTTEKTVKVRPGTELETTLPAGTLGLVAFDGTRHVFASSNVASIPAGYTLHVLRAPSGEALTAVHFAEQFLGALYVAAEFADGATFHFWLQSASTWLPDTDYVANALVSPTVDNSFIYRATRLGAPYPVWTPDTPMLVGDRIEPTVYNGLFFEVVSVSGATPRTGTAEPNFDVNIGAFVNETVDTNVLAGDPTPLPRPPDNNPNIPGRYGEGGAPSNGGFTP